jgi:prepilin-type N-terminal cleavage/methylation domain-containing protein
MSPTARARLPRRLRTRAAAEGGFTLVELLISMVILVIVVTSLTSVLVGASHTELDANKRFQAQLADRTGLDKVRREIHCAKAVTDANGATLNPGAANSAITVTLYGTCPTASGGVTTYSTWLTCPSSPSGHWILYRVATTATTTPYATCSTAGKVKWIDYLTTSTPFCLPDSSHACSGVLKPAMSLPLLHVTLPVNLNGPGITKESYNLADDIALRNGTRS